MQKEKRLMSVIQSSKYDSLMGIVYMLSGIFYSIRGLEKNLTAALAFSAIMTSFVIFSGVQHFTCRKEEMDEMAYEHLNEASRIVLLEQGLIGAVLLIVDVLLDLSKVVLSKELTIGNFMMLNPASCMMILIGFQYFMTGFHFRRLERE